jgi:hypothetical protein
MEDGNTREILERRVDQIEVVAHSADTGVWMEARNDGVAQLGRKHQSYGGETTG